MTRWSTTNSAWYRALRPEARRHGVSSCLHTTLEARARAEPERALLVDGRGYLTLGALCDAVRERAGHLLRQAGGVERVVAVQLEPSVEAVITYFACLAAGLRYLPMPLGPSSMAARVLRSLAPRVLVTGRDPANGAGIEIRPLSGESAAPQSKAVTLPPPDPQRIAHVLPTSGTATGTPKAVLTDHVGSMLSHEWRSRLWPYDPSRDVVGCNIFGIWDVVPALVAGIPVVMIDDETMRDPEALAAALVRYGITRLMLTPTLLDACLATGVAIDALRRLDRIVLCGEPVRAAVMARAWDMLEGVSIGNLYSSAECHDIAAGELRRGRRIASGLVADFADVHITDADDRTRLVPAGIGGRVLIGGAALAAGYVDPGETRRRFFDASFGGGEARRVYDSGDLGILHEDGELEVVGRLDEAVKVRGAWAEPDAIAAAIREHPAVARAAVIAEADSRDRTALWAFVVLSDPDAAAADLRRWLAERVSAQSVPGRIRIVDELPLLASGKADLRRLRAMGGAQKADSLPAAGLSLEAVVLATFRDVLEEADAGADEDFESLGGDSLSAVVLCGALRQATGRRVRVGDLRRNPCARALARHLEQQAPVAQPSARGLPALDLGDVARGRPSERRARRVFVTGATGMLGRALIERLLRETALDVVALVRAGNDEQAREKLAAAVAETFDAERVIPVVGDLGLPRFGLSPEAFRALAKNVDAVLHAGADLDMFADFETLEAVNVGGTREAVRLAFEAGARFHHVSSSAVLPLDPAREWSEDAWGVDLAESLAAELTDSDGYSLSKLTAEALVWLAEQRGLSVTVTRLAHLVGPGVRSRLTDTLEAFSAAGALPAGQWCWQLSPVDAVSRHLVAWLGADPDTRLPRLIHLTTRPLHMADVAGAFAARGITLRALSLPAFVSELAALSPGDAHWARIVRGLDQLVDEFGPRAALNLADARLLAQRALDADSTSLMASMTARRVPA